MWMAIKGYEQECFQIKKKPAETFVKSRQASSVIIKTSILSYYSKLVWFKALNVSDSAK